MLVSAGGCRQKPTVQRWLIEIRPDYEDNHLSRQVVILFFNFTQRRQRLLKRKRYIQVHFLFIQTRLNSFSPSFLDFTFSKMLSAEDNSPGTHKIFSPINGNEVQDKVPTFAQATLDRLACQQHICSAAAAGATVVRLAAMGRHYFI